MGARSRWNSSSRRWSGPADALGTILRVRYYQIALVARRLTKKLMTTPRPMVSQ